MVLGSVVGSSTIITSTPHGPRPGTGSTTLRRISVDNVLAKEVQEHTFPGVAVRHFLEHAFGFDSESIKLWLPRVTQWVDSSDFQTVLSEYRTKMDEGPEPDLYPPFAKLANLIVAKADDVDGDGNPLNINFVPLGDVYIPSSSGKRKPDLLTLPRKSHMTEPSWTDALVVWEFKRDSSSISNKRKDVDADRDSDPFYVSSEKKRKTDIGGSNERISSRSKTLVSGSKTSGSASKLTTSGSKAAEFKLPSPNSAKVQLASYVAEMFSSDTFREWAFGVTINNKEMIIRYYDRTCIVESLSFKYMDEDLVDFVLLVIALRQCNWRDYGYSQLFQSSSKRRHNALRGSKFKPTEPIEQTSDDTIERLNWNKETEMYVGETLHRTYGIFGRSTVVCKVSVGRYVNGEWVSESGEKTDKSEKKKSKKKKKKPKKKRKGKRKEGDGSEDEGSSESESEGENFIMKASWQAKTRMKEEEIIQRARKVNSVNTPAVFYAYSCKPALPSEKLMAFLEPEKREWKEDRHLRFIVFRQYKPLYLLKGKVYKKAFSEIVRCECNYYY